MVVGRAAGDTPDLVGNGKARYTSPTVTNLEQFQSIDEGVDLLLRRTLLEYRGKHAGRAEKIAFPEFVPGARGERRMEDEFDLRAIRKPFGDLERGAFDGGEPQRKRLQSAKSQAAIVRR